MAINKDTKIEFTVGMLLSLLGGVLSIFTAFYFVVQKPNNDNIKNHTDEKFELHKEYLNDKFKEIDDKLNGFSTGLSNLTEQVQILNYRTSESQAGNTSGALN